MHRSTKQSSGIKRFFNRALVAVGTIGVGLGLSSSPVLAQSPVSPKPVPQHWISYAQMASNQLEGWLSDPADDAVQRLHAWMQERMLQEGQALPPPLIVRLWVKPDGMIDRVEFASIGKEQADQDLRAVLQSRPLSEPPPADMRLPMVLQLSLKFIATS